MGGKILWKMRRTAQIFGTVVVFLPRAQIWRPHFRLAAAALWAWLLMRQTGFQLGGSLTLSERQKHLGGLSCHRLLGPPQGILIHSSGGPRMCISNHLPCSCCWDHTRRTAPLAWTVKVTEQRPKSEHTQRLPYRKENSLGLKSPHQPFPKEYFRF